VLDNLGSWSDPEWSFLPRQVRPYLEPDQEQSLFENQDLEHRVWSLFEQTSATPRSWMKPRRPSFS
jgi:hypothetical protein